MAAEQATGALAWIDLLHSSKWTPEEHTTTLLYWKSVDALALVRSVLVLSSDLSVQLPPSVKEAALLWEAHSASTGEGLAQAVWLEGGVALTQAGRAEDG